LLSALVVPPRGDHDLLDNSLVFVFSSAPALFGCSPSVLDFFVSVWVSRSALAVPMSVQRLRPLSTPSARVLLRLAIWLRTAPPQRSSRIYSIKTKTKTKQSHPWPLLHTAYQPSLAVVRDV
jgi:hypothetical protein